MSNTHDTATPTVADLLERIPAMLGLVSEHGACLFTYGTLSRLKKSAPDSPSLPLHLKDLFPFISNTPDFWRDRIKPLSENKKPTHLNHMFEDGSSLLLVLFPCSSMSQLSTQSSVGMLALEIAEEQPGRDGKYPPNLFSDRMISVLGHALSNPLSAIGAGLRVLEISPPDTPTDEVTGMRKRQLAQASRLVNDLLDVSSLRHTELSLSPKDALLHEVITLSLDAVQHRLGAKTHTLSVDVPDESVTVFCDVGRLSQAVTNLLHNAIKYHASGGAHNTQCEAAPRAACDLRE
jgi:signal transduction histidine kinase